MNPTAIKIKPVFGLQSVQEHGSSLFTRKVVPKMDANNSSGSPRPGLPDPASVVFTETLPSPQPLTRAAAATGLNNYRVLRTTQIDEYDHPVTTAEVAPFSLAPTGGDTFQGSSRKAAKLSLSDAKMESFKDVAALLKTLPSVATMAKLFPPGSDGPTSQRVSQEKRNVHLKAFLYAASRESDNDFHLIIGGSPSVSPAVYMTIEVSGLPPQNSSAFSSLNGVRDAFKHFFGTRLPAATYDFYDPPIPIEVQGSLFFDAKHAQGSRPGPATLRPHMPTIWEIHPLSKLVLEP